VRVWRSDCARGSVDSRRSIPWDECCAPGLLAGILMLTEFNSVRVGHGDALLLVTVLSCFLGGVDPFGGFGRVAPVFVSLLILQTLSSGLNLLGASQHLSTAVWGLFLIAVMVFRSSTPTLRALFASVRK
jgi:ribose/xylose/arabinose/galactoside ABC-type transport system permease subunit